MSIMKLRYSTWYDYGPGENMYSTMESPYCAVVRVHWWIFSRIIYRSSFIFWDSDDWHESNTESCAIAQRVCDWLNRKRRRV